MLLSLEGRVVAIIREQSDALVNQLGEERRGDEELAPLRIERRGRLGGNRVIKRAALLLELADIVADRDKHVAIGRKFGLVADRVAVARDDDRLVGNGGDIVLL